MFLMFYDVNLGNFCGIGIKLYYRIGCGSDSEKKDSYIENVELLRSLFFVSLRGFLFCLYKNELRKFLS